jgi:1-acyl-sn-glycerol-3-phosphate acyltransferase
MNLALYRFVATLARLLLRAFWRFRALGTEKVPAEGPVIVACNHVSYFDPPALGCALRRPIRYMAKRELFAIPLLGPLIRGLGAYPVDRSRHTGAAIKQSLAVLQAGAAIGIFPEGTRNRDGAVKPHIGVALLAARSGAAVVPAYVEGTAHANRLHRITVTYGDPVSFRRGKKASREELARWTDELMALIAALRPGGKTASNTKQSAGDHGGNQPSS